jgi:Nickel/cobalt transporter regulator/Glycine zipper 2TM domain
MSKVGVTGMALALVLAPEIAAAQMVGAPPIPSMPPMARPMPSAPMAMPPAMPPMTQPMPHGPGRPMPMPRMPAPPMPGPGAYVAPSYGYTLPGQWMAPAHFVGNYWSYGLPAPAHGFGWSRYHDDYVLTDSWGRVYDWRDSRDYRDGRWRDGRRNRDRSGIVGALLGAAIGAVSGNLIAGAGDRLAGSLIGGGLGALAGQAIDKSVHRDRDRGPGYGHGRGGDYGPHWGRGGYHQRYVQAPCDCGGETVTTTTTTYPERVTVRKVRYVTEYVRVPVRHAPVRTKYVRTKYVKL